MQNKKLDTLTSLRFFAAAMIVIGHAHALFGSAGIATTLSLAQGVSFFFVLSGFILAYNYPRLDSGTSIGKFWLARIARIWPAHIAVILVLLLIAGVSNTDGLAPNQKVLALLANVFLLQSLIPFRDYFLSFNGVAWSISTELVFYLAFPLLLANMHKVWALLALLLLSIVCNFLFVGALGQIPMDESVRSLNLMGLLYVNPFVRIFEFYLGMLACQVYTKMVFRKPMLPTTATIAEIAIFSFAIISLYLSPRIVGLIGWHGIFANVLSYYLSKSGSALIFFFLIIVFALQQGWLSWILKRTVFVFLGEVSFALYLVHTNILDWFRLHYELHFSRIPIWQSYILYWIASIFSAYLLYALVEKPCRKIILGLRSLTLREMLWIVAGKKQLGLGLAGLVLMIGGSIFWKGGHGCQNAECASLQERAAYRDIAAFHRIAKLQAMTVDSTPEGLTLNLLWSAIEPDPEIKVALHVLDRDGKMIWQNDYNISKSVDLKPGERWIDTIKIPKKAISAEWDGLGIAMYKSPNDLMKVEATRTDWDQKRALLKVPEFQRAGRKL